MKKIVLLLLIISVSFTSCKSTKRTTYTAKKQTKTDRVIANANSYKGTKYKYGGTTKKGMDCSGLIYTAFQKENIQLPRVSSAMAKTGKSISLQNVKKGDLLFFKTSRKNRINHVGLVTSVRKGQIQFIHATTSRGVIKSMLSEKYWKKAYKKAKRIL